jgi:hypothetical protein
VITTNSAALTAEQTTPKLTIGFSHRVIEGYNPACADSMILEVETMLMRSKGVLNILSDLHLETHLNQINSDSVSWTLMSVIRELDDVYALVSTYRDAIANQKT